MVLVAAFPCTNASLPIILAGATPPSQEPILVRGEVARQKIGLMFNINRGLVFGILHMEMRWRMIVKEHPNENAVKAADGWHEKPF